MTIETTPRPPRRIVAITGTRDRVAVLDADGVVWTHGGTLGEWVQLPALPSRQEDGQ